MEICCTCPTVNISELNFKLLICFAKNLIWTILKALLLKFGAPSDSRFSNSCILAKYYLIHQWKAYLFSFQIMYESQLQKTDCDITAAVLLLQAFFFFLI